MYALVKIIFIFIFISVSIHANNQKFIWVSDKNKECSIYIDKYFVLKHSSLSDEVDYYIDNNDYVNELTWVGNCKDGKAVGVGKVDIDDGLFKIEGNFKNGKLDGLYYAWSEIPEIDEDGDNFEGEGIISFKNSVALGKAYFLSYDRVYSGNFKNNTFNLENTFKEETKENKRIVELIKSHKYVTIKLSKRFKGKSSKELNKIQDFIESVTFTGIIKNV